MNSSAAPAKPKMAQWIALPEGGGEFPFTNPFEAFSKLTTAGEHSPLVGLDWTA